MSDRTPRSEDFCQDQPVLLAHLEAVLQHNHKKNLTSIRGLSAGKVLHIEDSLAVLPEVRKAPAGQMADLGSGAGYPGIPLALISGRLTTLIEANKKKAEFLQRFLDDKDLVNTITVSSLRSEELAQEIMQGHKEPFALVTARAVAELPVILELAAPLLMKGGHFLALKGRPDATELERGAAAAEKLNMRLLSTRHYTLSGKEREHKREFEYEIENEHEIENEFKHELEHESENESESENEQKRCILVYEKKGDSPLSLPRRPGMAAKHPLA